MAGHFSAAVSRALGAPNSNTTFFFTYPHSNPPRYSKIQTRRLDLYLSYFCFEIRNLFLALLRHTREQQALYTAASQVVSTYAYQVPGTLYLVLNNTEYLVDLELKQSTLLACAYMYRPVYSSTNTDVWIEACTRVPLSRFPQRPLPRGLGAAVICNHAL